MNYSHFTVESTEVFTEERHPELWNYAFFCHGCGATWARIDFGFGAKWNLYHSPCSKCKPRGGGSLLDAPDRALHLVLPKALLLRELDIELSLHGDVK